MRIPQTEQHPDRRRATTQPAKTLSIALVCAGGISQSWIIKLPRLVERLGPVKAPTSAVARRIVNTLRYGWPVEDVSEFDCASWVFIAVPDELLPATLDELAGAELNWAGKTLVVLDTETDCQELGMFALRNANVATVNHLDGFSDLRLVVQSDARTAKEFRKLVGDGSRRMLELEPGAKGLYLAALTFATSLTTPLIAACTESLMKAGFEPAQAASIAEHALSRTRRAYAKAGRKGWQGPLASKDTRAVRRQWESLRRNDPLLADYFIESATTAMEYFRQDAHSILELLELPRRSGKRLAPVLAPAFGQR